MAGTGNAAVGAPGASRRRWRVVAASVAAVVAAGAGIAVAVAVGASPESGLAHRSDDPGTWAASGLAAKSHDVGTWAASPQRTSASLNNETARDIVHTSIGGSGVRIRLSNAFGTQPVTFTDAYIGLRDRGAAIVAGSNRQVTFAGSTWVTIPAGTEVLSDPLPTRLPPKRISWSAFTFPVRAAR